ncbi:L-lactate permease [Desulfocurvibacter africanus]|uniref:L-lactate permease n=1 Tax=Desulfocurvibacter africanus TaxID=873 RepID=UPI0004064C13|nr:lactate permease LctP family transporter [Desulfocurvibacter africanus]
MQWVQEYNPLGNILLSAFVAAIPLCILFYMLAVRRSKGHLAALAATGAAILLAMVFWGMPAELALDATAYGAAFGVFPIVWIVVTAIWVYNMTVESGEFEIIKNSLACITEDRRLQAIFIAFAFGSFIEGTAGFGTPVAITAAMLVGLGFNPLYAAGICLIANTAPVAFGAIGIPIVVAAKVTDLDLMTISRTVGRQLPLLSLIVPLWLSVTMCGFRRSLEVLPAILVAGACFAGSQFLVSNYMGPYLPDIISAIVTIAGLGAFLKVWQPKSIWRFADEPAATQARATCAYSRTEVIRAWLPWLVLALMVFLWGLEDIKNFLNSIFALSFEWPGLHDAVLKDSPIAATDTSYPATYAFNLLSAAGTAILFAGLIAVFILPRYGLGKATACFGRTAFQLRYPIMTIAMILGLAYIMNYSGMSSTMGLAFTLTGPMFPFFSPILGWLGVFLTGSDTSSNALFGALQKTTAQQIGVSPELCVAANASGGVAGKMISPQSISVATAATRLVGHEGDLFRFTLFHSIAMVLVMSVLTLMQAYTLRWTLP